MSAFTITGAAGTSTPLLVVGYSVTTGTQHVVHEIIGRSDPDVTFQAVKTRSGTWTFLFATRQTAEACRRLHTNPGAFTLTNGDLDDEETTYVVTGDITVDLDDDTQVVWLVQVPFREVIA